VPDVLEQPAPARRPGTITAQNARAFAARSVAARAAKAERRLAPASAPLAAPLPAVDDYTRDRLACVRVQLAQVDKAILRESAKEHPDGQRLNWLAQAQDRLAEQERILAGRPLPGSRRPREDRERAPTAGAWLDLAALAAQPATLQSTCPATQQPAPPPPAGEGAPGGSPPKESLLTGRPSTPTPPATPDK